MTLKRGARLAGSETASKTFGNCNSSDKGVSGRFLKFSERAFSAGSAGRKKIHSLRPVGMR